VLAQLHTITARHDHVQHHEIYADLSLAQHPEGLDGAVGLQQLITLLTEDARGQSTRNALVVDNEDGRGVTWRWMGQS
jgi:hypothetical protein